MLAGLASDLSYLILGASEFRADVGEGVGCGCRRAPVNLKEESSKLRREVTGSLYFRGAGFPKGNLERRLV